MYTLPKKLATTMGVELTFMPRLFDDIYESSGGKATVWEHYEEASVRSFLASALKQTLQRKGIHYHSCDIDPACVEVSTRPYSTANSIRKIVCAIRSSAKEMQLSPTARWTGGGGAHIHTGVVGETEQQRMAYAAAMYVWAAENPWMPWAFIHRNDCSNAQAIEYKQVMCAGNDGVTLESLLGDWRGHVESYKHWRGEMVKAERKLHTSEVWGNRCARTNVEGNDIWEARYYMRCRRRDVVAYEKEIVRMMGEDLDYARRMAEVKEDWVAVNKINTDFNKKFFMRRSYYGENGTLEFRCFLMPEFSAGHKKHFALVDAIVRRAWRVAEAGEFERVPKPVDVGDLRRMKYSKAKLGFNSMLVDLGLDPKDFRSECVNIALRIRSRRKGNSYI